MRRFFIALVAVIAVGVFMVLPVQAESLKIGYVDLRRAFYEYEKSKVFDKELTEVTNERGEERNKMVEEIRKLREAAELLNDKAAETKQKEIDDKITKLNNFDRDTRQELLNKKNDMFRQIIEDIQKVVNDIGKKEAYTYIFDSRNIMYSREQDDLTERVLEVLNK